MVTASPVGGHRDPAVLLTGFDPFAGDAINPSWQAAHDLDGTRIAGHRVIAARLPTVFDRSIAVLRELLAQHRPVLVICTGQAGGRSSLSLERVAINVNDARIADNASAQPVDTPVIAAGPAAYFTRLPIKAMLAALESAGVRAEVSQTAGTFVCNHVFYGLMHELATRETLAGVRGGLIHVPWLPQQGQPSMPLQDIVRGLEVAIHCALTTDADIRKQAGALS
ncbi:MAG: pyroglutamyl-peptidase I [Pseudomonadota bacterium]|nr:pyroglutamyl-peptidase I [Pseudomonadota bacterium]